VAVRGLTTRKPLRNIKNVILFSPTFAMHFRTLLQTLSRPLSHRTQYRFSLYLYRPAQFAGILVVLFQSITSLDAQTSTKPRSGAGSQNAKPIPQKAEPFTPQQILTADTTRPRVITQDSTVLGTTPPGEYPFSPEQDRAFYEALRLPISASTRFQFATRQFSAAYIGAQEARQFSPREAMIANMDINPSAFVPTPQEQTAYNYGVAQSFTIPGVFDPFARYGGLPGVGGRGFSIPLSLIGSLLGIGEDITATIRYTVEQPAEVEITIYSIQAIAIARVLKTTQSAGGYAITWNGKNDGGFPVATGDYIAEVRIGTAAYVRKRIRIG
jgi:FlgD Ig-like domain